MSEHELFEKSFPPPPYVEWSDKLNDYTYTDPQALRNVCKYSGQWQAWQAARSQGKTPKSEHRKRVSKWAVFLDGLKTAPIPEGQRRTAASIKKEIDRYLEYGVGADNSQGDAEPVAWRDLVIGEVIKPGDRFLGCNSQWVDITEEHLEFFDEVSACTRPTQRRVYTQPPSGVPAPTRSDAIRALNDIGDGAEVEGDIAEALGIIGAYHRALLSTNATPPRPP